MPHPSCGDSRGRLRAHRCALPANTVPWGDGTCEPFAVAKRDALKWLRKNAPPADLRDAAAALRHARRRGRLGRRRGGRGGERDADRENEVALGLGRATATFSETTSCLTPRANEPRTHWHGLLAKAVEPILSSAAPARINLDVAGEAINSEFWQNVEGRPVSQRPDASDL